MTLSASHQLQHVDGIARDRFAMECLDEKSVGWHRDRVEPVGLTKPLDAAGHAHIGSDDLVNDFRNVIIGQAKRIRHRRNFQDSHVDVPASLCAAASAKGKLSTTLTWVTTAHFGPPVFTGEVPHRNQPLTHFGTFAIGAGA